MEVVKVVLASPSDLKEERMLISNIVNRKDKIYKKSGVTLDLRRWEDTAPGASKIGGQGKIDDDLGIQDADIFICMYWNKLGTVIDGLGETGTEHELNIALQAFETVGKPDIKFLLKESSTADPGIEKISEKVKPIALYKEFQNIDDLNNIIDQIITEECNKRIRVTGKSEIQNRVYTEVDSISKLFDVSANNKTIFMQSGYYDVLKGIEKNCFHYEKVYDGYELIVEDLSDFSLIGNHTNLVVEPRYASVISFRNCENIHLSGLTIGHTPHKGECVGAVLRFDNCTNISLNCIELFGCGTYGVESYNSNEVVLNGCHIYECSHGAVYAESSDIRINNSEISECKNTLGCLFELANSYMSMRNVFIHDNMTDNCIFSLVDSNIFGEAVSIINNKFADIGYMSEGLFVKDNEISDNYFATIESTEKVSKEEYNLIKLYLMNKAEIVEANFENGKVCIQFNAKSMYEIEKIGEYIAGTSKFEMSCG